MIILATLLDVLRWIAAVLSLVLGIRRLYRWFRRKIRRKQKTTA